MIPKSDGADFSLMVGGPLYQLFERSRLVRPPLDWLERRVVVLTMIAWLPLLVLSLIGGHLLPRAGHLSFLHDVECHVRLLIVLPLLLAAELPAHERLRGVVHQFVARHYVPASERARFDAAVASALRLRNSVPLEIALLVLAFTAGHWLWRSEIAYEGNAWYATGDGATATLTLPGYWYAYVSIPLFQFIGFRWYFRLLLWFRLLWQISRLRLDLIATHPDRACGLGFVGNSTYAFALFLVAHGALLSGWIAARVVHDGTSPLDFQVEAVVLIGCIVFVMLAPLCVFMPILSSTKRRGRRDYGLFAALHSQAFERKWILGERPEGEPMLGSPDMSSLADLGSSYAVVQSTRIVPFGLKLVGQVAVVTALPLAPLVFAILPFHSLVMRAVKIIL
jgi:hypothetical protein